MAPHHRAPRRSRSTPHGRAFRRTGLLAVVALLAGALVGVPQMASAAEPRVLRTVDVTVGDDGSVTGVTSTVVSDDGSGEVTSESEEVAPAEADLPVRVLTTYRSDAGTGTDLSDLAGYSGPLTIDVSVQNTTVRPQLLSYASSGVGVTEYALVGSPLTVVGGVVLPGSTRVVTSDDTADATNGVLGQDADGTPVVQWSAMLAPPQLAATATFRLVLDVDDFEVPTFDLSVQPGLVTDPSVESLLVSSFSDTPGSSRTLQLATLATIGGVSTTLEEVGLTLDEISAALSTTATSFGRNARGGLEDANGALADRLAGTVAELGSASTQVSATIDTAQRNGEDALGDSLGEIRDVLGTGPTPPAPPAPPVSGTSCATTTSLPSTPTLLGLLASIRASLDAYGAATEDCRDDIVEGLTEALGTDAERADPATCAGTAPSAVCLVDDVRGGLSSALATLGGLADDVTDADADADTSLGHVSDTISTLRTSVADLGAALTTLGTVDVDAAETTVTDVLSEVDGQLGTLRDQLVGLQVLTAATGDLAGDLTTIASTADAQLDLVGAGGALRTGIDDLLALVCTSAGSGASADLLDLLDQVLGLGLCPAGTEDVVAQLDLVEDAWESVAALVGGADDALPAQLADFSTVVEELLGGLDGVRLVLADAVTDTGDVTSAFSTLVGQVDALSTSVAGVLGTPVDDLDCTTPTAAVGSFADLSALWAGASCRLDAVDGLFGAYVAEVGDSIAVADSSLDGTAEDLLGIRDETASGLSAYLDSLSGGLAGTGENAEGAGAAQVRDIDEQARASTAAASSGLAANLGGARALLTSNLGDTQTGLGATRTELAAALDRVLEALGAPTAADGSGGTGIIGSLGRNSASAGSSVSVITEATSDTAAFSSRRSLDLRAIDRAQEQFRQASVLEQEVATRGYDGTASSVVTVFTFHVGGS